MPAPDLIDLMWLYARRGVSDWSQAPDELRQRAKEYFANRIADTEWEARKTIDTPYSQVSPTTLRFIPMPTVGTKKIERCFFFPIRDMKDDGSSITSFDLFLLVTGRDCLALRFEHADPPGQNHSYTHVQLCKSLVRETMAFNVLPGWMPDSYPAFPISASNSVELFLAMAIAVHGYHGGLMRVLLDIFTGRPNDAKYYVEELRTMLRI